MSEAASRESFKSARYTAIAAGAGAVSAIAALISAVLLLSQLRAADTAALTGNSYTVQKDLLGLIEGMYVDIGKVHRAAQADPALVDELQRRVERLDGLFAAVNSLAVHYGLTEQTWLSILQRTCPTFDDRNINYQVDGTPTPSIKDACTAPPQDWKTGKP